MNVLFVNLDKKQYFQLRLFTGNGSRSSKFDAGFYQEGNFALSLLLGIEGSWRQHPPGTNRILLGSWRGNRIVILRGGDPNATEFLSDELQALAALGATPDTAYSDVRDNFEDVSHQVLGLVNKWRGKYYQVGDSLNQALTRPSNWAWLTDAELTRILDQVSNDGETRFTQYCQWLQKQFGLPKNVKDFVQRCRFGRQQGAKPSERRWHVVSEDAETTEVTSHVQEALAS